MLLKMKPLIFKHIGGAKVIFRAFVRLTWCSSCHRYLHLSKNLGAPSSDLNPQPLANVIACAIVDMVSLKKKCFYHDLIVMQAHNH